MRQRAELARPKLSWLTSSMRALPLIFMLACAFDEPDTRCPVVPCAAGEVCTMEGECVVLRQRDAGPADAGAPPDAGPVCGNGVVEGSEGCDDANSIETDGCRNECFIGICGDLIVRTKTEDCDLGQDNGGDECSRDCTRVGVFDGSSEEAAALSCRHLKRDFPRLLTDGYWLDLDGAGPEAPVRVVCEMGLDGGGWTHMVHLNQGDTLWNAFSDRMGAPGGAEAWGLRIADLLQDDPEGEDLDFVFALRGTFAGQVIYSPFYTDLKGAAFDPLPVFEVYDDDGFEWREPGAESQTCTSQLWHRTEAWNWAAARGKFGCDGWSGGAGFIIHGSDDAPETAQSVWGMNLFGTGERGADFSSLSLFVR